MSKSTASSKRRTEHESFLSRMAQYMFEAEAEFRRETNQNGTFFFGLIKVCVEYLQKNGKVVTKDDRWYIPPPSPAIEGNFSAKLFFESRFIIDVAEFSSSNTETLALIAFFLEKHVVPAFTEHFKLQLAFIESSTLLPKSSVW